MGRPATMFFWKGRGFATDAGGRRTILVKGPKTRANREQALRRLATMFDAAAMTRPEATVPPLARHVETVGEIIDLFLDDCDAAVRAGQMKSSTVRSYYRPYLTVLRNEFGALAVGGLSRRGLLEYRAKLTGRGLAPNTVKNYLDALRSALRWAQKNDLIGTVSVPRFPCMARRRRETLPTADELRVLLDAAPPDVRDVLDTLLSIAVRPGDLYNLRRESVDIDRGVLNLPDSKTGPRLVCLVPAASSILSRRLQSDATQVTGFVFTSAKGRPWNQRYFGEQIRKIRARTGLGSHVTAYVLRHVWTTNAFLRGLDLATVRALRGDRDVRTTMLYEHVSCHLDHLQTAARRAVGLDDPGDRQRTIPNPGGAL